MPLLGAHMSIAGGFQNAVHAAAGFGMETVQLFTHSPSRWVVVPSKSSASRRKASSIAPGSRAGDWSAEPLQQAQISAFRTALAQTGLRRPVVHASYLINLASPEPALWRRSVEAMIVEVKRAALLGVGDVVVHPGAHMGQGEDKALGRVARALVEVCERTRGLEVWIDLESTAGQGSTIGHTLEHLGELLESIGRPHRFGICLDTCHLFAAGFALAEQEDYNRFIEDFNARVGLGRVRVWHLNDSCKGCGSRVDRHAGIGRGLMGVAPFREILNDRRFAEIPMILETPKGMEAGEHLDAINLRVLRQLLKPSPAGGGARRKRRVQR